MFYKETSNLTTCSWYKFSRISLSRNSY